MSQQTRQHTDWSCIPKCKLGTGIQNKIKKKKGDRLYQFQKHFLKWETIKH